MSNKYDRWLNVLRTRTIECKNCGTWYHIGTRSKIYAYKYDRLGMCPKCLPEWYKKTGMRYSGRDHWKDYNIRKVRSDKQSLDHKRKVTRDRVKRWRKKQSAYTST